MNKYFVWGCIPTEDRKIMFCIVQLLLPWPKKLRQPRIPNYRRVHARESSRLYLLVRCCLIFFGQGGKNKIVKYREMRHAKMPATWYHIQLSLIFFRKMEALQAIPYIWGRGEHETCCLFCWASANFAEARKQKPNKHTLAWPYTWYLTNF